jgi:hypothetical protein
MAKELKLETITEFQANKSVGGENQLEDKQDGLGLRNVAEIPEKKIVHVSFVHQMEERIKQFIGLLKIIIFLVAALLFLIFVWHDIFSSSDKKVPEDVKKNLMNLMKLQAGGSFSPIQDTSSNSTEHDFGNK